MTSYPECEKLVKHKQESQIIGTFLDWLQNEKGYEIAYWDEASNRSDDEQLYPCHKTIEQWLAEYFNIDLNKVEKERQQIIEDLRGENV
jgi:hypothetical protein